MNKHERKFKKLLASQSPEEIAQDEDRIIRDSARMERLPLIKYMREIIKKVNEIDPTLGKCATEAFDSTVLVLALWKRNEVMARVGLRKRYRNL